MKSKSYKSFQFSARDFKLNIYHVTYYCILENIVKIGEFFEHFTALKIAPYIRTMFFLYTIASYMIYVTSNIVY